VVNDLEYDAFLREACPPLDLAWRKYRRRAARRRVRDRIEELDLDGYRSYLDLLRKDGEEASRFPDRIRLTLSRFFREKERWESLAGSGIPCLLEESPSPVLRAWSVGCCGGEEPYTLALLWRDRLKGKYPGRSIAITATDIDEPSLQRASEARYEFPSLREIPEEMRQRWFHRDEGGFRLDGSVKDMVSFTKRNLFDEELDGGLDIGMDLVLCRYFVFTYYRGARRQAAVKKLWESTRPGGLLMIGSKEGLTPEDRAFFEPWKEETGLFRRSGA
jgi:chemotaxis methyl-accepting protein methylase